MIRIGSVTVKSPLVLASMEEHTDLPTRALFKSFGAALVITEMVEPTDVVAGDRMAKRMLAFAPSERPIAGQLLGTSAEETAEAARTIESLGFDLIDLNLSCPIRRVIDKGHGGALLKDPPSVERLFRAVTAAVRVPVTLKFRSGYELGEVNAPDVARAAEQGGAAGCILHARGVVQAYKGDADWRVIGATKAAVAMPVGGAGGIRTPEDAVRMKSETGCDLLLLARGVLGNPWLISRTRSSLDGRPLPPPSREERLRVCTKHMDELARWHGLTPPNTRLTRQALYYGKDLPDFARLRERLHSARSMPEFRSALKEFFRG